jgi:hypothetical protein
MAKPKSTLDPNSEQAPPSEMTATKREMLGAKVASPGITPTVESYLQQPLVTYMIGRMRNSGSGVEGTNLPPPVQGQFRIPSVNRFRVIATSAGPNSTTNFTLAWQTPYVLTQNIGLYNIYMLNTQIPKSQPTLVGASSFSPVTVNANITTSNVKVVFYCQSELHNGLKAEVNFTGIGANGLAAPTCVGITL